MPEGGPSDAVPKHSSTSTQRWDSDTGDLLLQSVAQASQKDVVMFLESEFFFRDDGQKKELSVVRVGSCEHQVKVRYKTVATASPDGGTSGYQPVHGTVTFVAGDAFEVITISTDSDLPWELMENFTVKLIDVVEGPAIVGPLNEAEVYLVDEDGFPTDEVGDMFANAVEHNDKKREPGPYRLLFSFIWLMWRVHWRSLGLALLGLVYMQVHLILKEVILLLVVNQLTSGGSGCSADGEERDGGGADAARRLSSLLPSPPAAPRPTAPPPPPSAPAAAASEWSLLYCLAAGDVASAALLCYLDHRQVTWGRNGPTLKLLRTWLVCKLLWFNADTRASLASFFETDIEQITSSAGITQAEDVVMHAYHQHMLVLSESIGALLQFAYALCAPPTSDRTRPRRACGRRGPRAPVRLTVAPLPCALQT